MNIIDYLEWRGDLPFDFMEFNEVDAMILCQCVYWPMEIIASKGFDAERPARLGDVYDLDLIKVHPPAIDEDDITIAKLIAKSKRFSSISMYEMEKVTNAAKGIQFCAVTFKISEDNYFIAFRGTDNSLVGWKENMNLAYNDKVPSQEAAVEYIDRIASATKGILRMGGHSKGGNLAVYGAAFSSDKINDRITDVYNFDGPGFNDRVIQDVSFINIRNKVRTFVPETSIIGMLLEHRENYEVIHSTENNGFKAHHLTTWCVKPSSIVREDGLTKMGEVYHENISEWIANMDFEEKKAFVEVVYDLVDDYGTTDELFTTRNLLKVIKTYRKLDDEKKEAVSGAMSSLKLTIKENIKEHIFLMEEGEEFKLRAYMSKLKNNPKHT